MSKSILQIIYSCSVQKTGPKNTKYLRNESILKIGHHAKAIAFAKSSFWCDKLILSLFTLQNCRKYSFKKKRGYQTQQHNYEKYSLFYTVTGSFCFGHPSQISCSYPMETVYKVWHFRPLCHDPAQILH